MTLVIVLHEQTGQPTSCMRGLTRYASRVARSPMTDRFADAPAMRNWLWQQPVKLDSGEDSSVEQGCVPAQRSRLWPKDGLNCWESTAHWLGWHLRNQTPIEAHLYDSRINGQRHVFPAARELGEQDLPTPIVLQPPALGGGQRMRMQALVMDAAQALGPLPPPLKLLRRKEYFPWDNVGNFVVEMGGMQAAEHTGPLPEAVLSVLPSFWRQQSFRQWPTANGDLLFLILEKDWISLSDIALGAATSGISFAVNKDGGHGIANVIRVPGGALNSGRKLVDGAPPANALCECTETEPAQAWYNDLLGGVHWVGDKVLRVFGMGQVSDYAATAEGDILPDWSRTDDQRKSREPEAPKKKQDDQSAEDAKRKQDEQDRAEHARRARADELKQQEQDTRELLAQIRESEQRQRDGLDQAAQQYLDDSAQA